MTLDREAFQAWLDRYVEAWKTYEPDAIAALWSDDAAYRHHPEDEPIRGRQAIVDNWLQDRDEPGTYDGHYEPLAIDGENHVASGWSRDFANGELEDEYWNVFLCRFGADGRCTDFTEWWIQDRDFARRARHDPGAAALAEDQSPWDALAAS